MLKIALIYQLLTGGVVIQCRKEVAVIIGGYDAGGLNEEKGFKKNL